MRNLDIKTLILCNSNDLLHSLCPTIMFFSQDDFSDVFSVLPDELQGLVIESCPTLDFIFFFFKSDETFQF